MHWHMYIKPFVWPVNVRCSPKIDLWPHNTSLTSFCTKSFEAVAFQMLINFLVSLQKIVLAKTVSLRRLVMDSSSNRSYNHHLQAERPGQPRPLPFPKPPNNSECSMCGTKSSICPMSVWSSCGKTSHYLCFPIEVKRCLVSWLSSATTMNKEVSWKEADFNRQMNVFYCPLNLRTFWHFRGAEPSPLVYKNRNVCSRAKV